MNYPEIPHTQGMTKEESDRAWNLYFEATGREDDRILRPIREEAGYPTNPHDPDAWWDLHDDVTQRYIRALELAVTTQARVSAIVNKEMRR